MAIQQVLTEVNIPANADLSTNQYFFVKITNSSGTGQVALAGDGEFAIGVLQNKPSAAGDVAKVAISGIAKVEAGGSITAGDPVAVDASGNAVSASSGDIVVAVAVNSADDGDIFEVLLDARNAYANNITT